MEARAGEGAEAADVAGVLGDLGAEEDDVEHDTQQKGAKDAKTEKRILTTKYAKGTKVKVRQIRHADAGGEWQDTGRYL